MLSVLSVLLPTPILILANWLCGVANTFKVVLLVFLGCNVVMYLSDFILLAENNISLDLCLILLGCTPSPTLYLNLWFYPDIWRLFMWKGLRENNCNSRKVTLKGPVIRETYPLSHLIFQDRWINR